MNDAQKHSNMYSTCVMINKLCILYGITLLTIALTNAFLTKQELSKECLVHSPTMHSKSSKNEQQVVALILARGGSKGIRYKNLAKIADVSLLGRALRVIHNCHNCFAEVWVSTDNELVAQEARRYNAFVHYRSEYSARDEATSIESVREFLNGHLHIQNIALMQCTSVFIYEKYLEKAIQLFTPDVDCVFSIQRSWKLRWQQRDKSNRVEAINFNPQNRPRRQYWPGELVETGMFYFVRRNLIEQYGLFQNDRCQTVEIDEKHSLEIDNQFQLNLANILVDLDCS